jgi:hypothetical protein
MHTLTDVKQTHFMDRMLPQLQSGQNCFMVKIGHRRKLGNPHGQVFVRFKVFIVASDFPDAQEAVMRKGARGFIASRLHQIPRHEYGNETFAMCQIRRLPGPALLRLVHQIAAKPVEERCVHSLSYF